MSSKRAGGWTNCRRATSLRCKTKNAQNRETVLKSSHTLEEAVNLRRISEQGNCMKGKGVKQM